MNDISLLVTIGILFTLWVQLYQRAPLLLVTTGVGCWLALPPLLARDFSSTWMVIWGVFLALATVLNVPFLRRSLLTAPVRGLFKRAMPPISRTEQEALEAGTVWWDRELFSGRPDFKKLLDLPAPRLSAKARAFLEGPVERLCAMLDDWQVTHYDHDLSPTVWSFLKRERFFGMIIPERQGGLGFNALEHSAVVTKVASRSVTAAVTVMVPNSLGPAELLMRYGTEDQKNHYLPRLARGEEIPCFALTSPHAGSDAAAMPDTGVVTRGDFGGQRGVVGIRLDFDKRYITLAPVATVLGLAFRLFDPDHLLGEQEEIGITVALIPVKTRGIEIGERHDPLNVPFQNGPVRGRGVFIPLEWIIGGPERAGQGWRMLMECLAEGRSISLPALSTGAGKLAARVTGAYARVRQQFKMSVGHFEGVQEPLGRIAGETYLMDAVRTLTASAVDMGEKPSVISAIAKYQLTERMRRVINDSMDVHGGAGICMGPRNLVGRIYQSVPIGITVEGANILTRTLIAFGQGAMRAHPHLLDEVRAVQDPQGLKAFDRAFMGHLGFALSNGARALWMGLTGGRLIHGQPEGEEGDNFARLTHLSVRFALTADMALGMLGGSLKRREMLSGRLADALAHLYLGSAVMKRFFDQGRPEGDRPLYRWAMAHCLHATQEALMGFLDNFPYRFPAWVVGKVLFPWGRAYGPPSDVLVARAAEVILTANPARERLTEGIFIPEDSSEQMARLERALILVAAAERVERTLRKAIRAGTLHPSLTGFLADDGLLQTAVQARVVSRDEADLVRMAHEARSSVIQVDEFPPPPPFKEKVA